MDKNSFSLWNGLRWLWPNFEICEHTVLEGEEPIFDDAAAEGLTFEEVRARWPRGNMKCKGCGVSVIKYASYKHYFAGDW